MTLTATAIAELVFNTIIQTTARKPTEVVLNKVQELWQKVRGKVQDEGVTETALLELENQKSREILAQQIVPFLQVAMLKDPQFAQEIQNIAQQITQEIKTTSQDSIKQQDFEVNDNGVVAGTIKGEQQNIGGTHYHEKKS